MLPRCLFPQLVLVAALGIILVPSRPVCGCGFIESAGKLLTFREEAATSQIILFGRLENARKSPDGDTTDLVLLKAIKSDPILKGKTVVRLPFYVPIPDAKKPPEFLVFGEVHKGEVDYYRGVPGKRALLDYVEGILTLKGTDRVRVMRYCFQFLEHEDSAIAADAFAEFLKSTDRDIRRAGLTLAPEKLRRWLQNDKTAPDRLRLYAFLLAQCGNQKDAALLKKLLDKLVKEKEPPLIDGVFTAYALLDRKDGWAYVRRFLGDAKAGFMLRYSALRAVRYFYTSQREAVAEKELLAAIDDALQQPDMTDIPIDYLRRWKCWKLTDRILALSSKKGFDAPLIRRTILRYALQCPHKQATRFVAERRKADPSFVADAEELLRYEAEAVRSRDR